MRQRLPYIILAAVAVFGLWFSDYHLTPWVIQVSGYDRIQDKDLSVLLGHWIFGQLPRVLVCVAVWLVGQRLGLMPSLRMSLASGGSWRKVIVSGLLATAIMLTVTVIIGAAVGGTFGFHPYYTKMAGDLASNMYEEIVYRGLMFCVFYGVSAGMSFPLGGKLSRAGVVLGTLGSCIIFAAGHDQYPIVLQAAVGLVSVLLVYPWVAARSLWAAWIPHTLVDFIADSILKL